MASKRARSGGKYTGSHTTVIPAAAIVCDIAERCGCVSKISPGFIKTGLPNVKGKRRVKIQNDGTRLLLTVRDNISIQELHLYTTDTDAALRMLARDLSREGLVVTGAVGEQ